MGDARGMVSLVGAGPGDPGLITVAGLERLQQADVVVYDRLAGEALLSKARPDAELVYVGKESSRHTLTQEEINQLLVAHGSAGKTVCRLKGGDPFVFGRGGEEAIALLEAGIPFEVVPGVTSAIAAPAYAGIPVTHRRAAASFAVITGHEDPGRESSGLNWEKLSTATDTLVFLMGVERLAEIVKQLLRHGRTPETPAALVQWGTHSRQRTIAGTLESIVRAVEQANLSPPCVIIVGDVVALRSQLRWFDNRPLFGKRVLVTRSREQASELAALLERDGATVIQTPLIDIRRYSLDDAPHFLSEIQRPHDWVVFASANAVESFFHLAREAGFDSRCVGAARIAAVGPATARAVEAAGLKVDFVPDEATSRRIADAFPVELRGLRVLLPRPKVAPDDLPGALDGAGAEVTVLPVYETLPQEPPQELLEQVQRGEFDVITFTSSSTVKNLMTVIQSAEVPSKTQIVCIGPTTAATAREAGLRVDAVAEPHTTAGVAEAVRELLGLSGARNN